MAKKNKIWDSYIGEDGNQYMICANSEVGGKTFKGRYWKGKQCFKYTPVSEDAKAIVCPYCSRQLVDPPEIKDRRQSTGRPRGWQFMKEYVDKNGNVFHKGEEQKHLRGKFSPTIITETVKPTKKQKKEVITIALKNINSLKKSLNDITTKRERSSVESKIRKLNRIASGRFPRHFDIIQFIAK